MKTISGGCHCGAVRFSAHTELARVVLCNCSLCARKGMIHHQLAPENFTLESGGGENGPEKGGGDLVLYQFSTKTAKHWFCRHCGIHVYSNPRSAPGMVSLNMRCVGGFELETFSGEVIEFDGIHWEENVAALREKMGE